MPYTDNLYLKRIAEKLTSPIEGRHTNNYYLKIISKNIGKGGGGGSYDDTEIKRRITNVENGKQDKLNAGQNITISANTIAAREIIDDTINSTTTVWSSKKVKDLIEALEGTIKVSIVTTRPDPSVAVDKTMYYVGTEAPYHIWFFVNDSYTDVGTTEISLENYYTKEEVDELLDEKVDKVIGKSLVLDTDIAQITTNKIDIANLQTEIDTKLTDLTTSNFRNGVIITSIGTSSGNSTIPTGGAVRVALNSKQDTITASDQLTAPSDTDKLSYLNNVTNNRWTFAKIWEWIVSKLTSNTEKGIQVSDGKLGHTNNITAPTAKRILQATYDAQGHVKAVETEFNWSNTYNTSAENQLFTRKGANNLYKELTDVTEVSLTANTTYIDESYSKCFKMGNLYMFNLAFKLKSSDVPVNSDLYTLPVNMTSSNELYFVLMCTDPSAVPTPRLLQIGGTGSTKANKIFVKTLSLTGGKYYFASGFFIKRG